MALGIYEEEDIRAIAENIRHYAGGGSSMTVREMSGEIVRVHSAGMSDGYSEGYNACTSDMQDDIKEAREDGFTHGYSQGYTIGESLGRESGYNEGYTEGKASVKHIQFCLYHDWDYIDCCAFEGMTWREWVERKFNASFIVEGNKVKYDNGYQLYTVAEVSPDDVIVNQGHYETLPPPENWYLRYNGNDLTLYRYPEHYVESFLESEYNTIGLYMDDDGYVRMPTGEYVYFIYSGDEKQCVEGAMDPLGVDSYSDFYWYYEFIAAQYAGCRADIDGKTFKFVEGMTWQEFANSVFSDAIWTYGDEIEHAYGNWNAMYLDDVKVKPTDVLVDGAYYETRYE